MPRLRELLPLPVASDGFGPFWGFYEGRKKEQDKRRGHRWCLQPVTSARSAGSYRNFPDDRKWGQNSQRESRLRSLSQNTYCHNKKQGARPGKEPLLSRKEMLHTYEQKSQSQDEVVREARQTIRKLPQEMARTICTRPEIEQKMAQLAEQLETVKGKKSYGYLSKPVKKTVDEVVDKLEELQVVRACYDQWCRLQGEVESCYHDKPREKKSCPRRRSSGRSRTPSFRRRNAFGWRRSPSRMMTWLSAMSRNRCRASPLPAGNYGKSSGTRPFL